MDTCTKTTFSFSNVLYEQTMGSRLGPVLANMLMAEFERVVVQELFDSGTLPFYIRYIDDTLVLIKPGNFDTVYESIQ